MVRLCLAGPEAEKEFCGPINDDSDRADYQMAREYLARSVANPLQAAAELARYRDAATLGAFALGISPHSPTRRRLAAAGRPERRANFRTRGLTRRWIFVTLRCYIFRAMDIETDPCRGQRYPERAALSRRDQFGGNDATFTHDCARGGYRTRDARCRTAE
jgi:hypothetical protein